MADLRQIFYFFYMIYEKTMQNKMHKTNNHLPDFLSAWISILEIYMLVSFFNNKKLMLCINFRDMLVSFTTCAGTTRSLNYEEKNVIIR